MAQISYHIYDKVSNLPADWDQVAAGNIFLTCDYLRVLEVSAPENMSCYYIAIFNEMRLCGIALSQFIDLNQLETLGERDEGFKTRVRNFVFKNLSSHVLFIGNNMLTGQNAFSFINVDKSAALQTLEKAADELAGTLKKRGTKVHLTIFKDFEQEQTPMFSGNRFDDYFQFSTQPNMVFSVRAEWKSFDDYIAALAKKYRDQYKRSQKRSDGIVKCKMPLADIKANQDAIYDLYLHVAKAAPFNTFFLAKNHFAALKEYLGDRFLFYGYFHDGVLVGFNTLIKNGDSLDTYFLGYDDTLQREKMLYLNMLYDMIGYAIKKGFTKIIFARTALEIKSSIGASPEVMHGFMLHSNRLVHRHIAKIFNYVEPVTQWQQRHPFK